MNTIGWNHVKIILIEAYTCNNKDELTARERYWIDELKPSLNKCKPTETEQEYRIRTQEKNKRSHERNRESRLQKQKEYWHTTTNYKERVTCECGAVMSRQSLTRHRKRDSHQAWVEETGYVPPPKPLVKQKETITC